MRMLIRLRGEDDARTTSFHGNVCTSSHSPGPSEVRISGRTMPTPKRVRCPTANDECTHFDDNGLITEAPSSEYSVFLRASSQSPLDELTTNAHIKINGIAFYQRRN